jgi:hypothetical protein
MIGKWPRYAELLVAIWLIASGWTLDRSPDYRAVAVASGLAVVAFDFLSIAGVLRYLHLLILPVSAAQIALGLFYLPVRSAGAQNLIVVGLLLAMLAILPTEATQPPPEWRNLTPPPADRR